MEENQAVILLVLVGAIIMLSMAMVVIFFVAQHRKKYLVQQNEMLRVKNESEQALLRAVINTQEEERTRTGLNLHDSVGAELSMVKLNLSRYVQDTSLVFSVDHFRREVESLENAIQTIRGVVKDLYPKSLQIYGFITAFGGVVDRLDDSHTITASFNCKMPETDLHLDFSTKLDLYRICQEILNNLIKYSACKNLVIDMLPDGPGVKIIFRHDGIAFLNADADNLILQNTGIGLKSIKNRTNLIKGKINYLRDHNHSVIEIFVPLKND
ncbi:MAG TPA: histidine kinase [Bacteroidia bacterium]|nr:histidine kinase [Bacteroidia bacterium]